MNATRLDPHVTRLSCVVTAYNEALVIERFLIALHAQLQAINLPFQIIVVDDGSRDDTALLVKQYRQNIQQHELALISFSRNFGKEAALTAGLDFAEGDIVLLIDSDFQHPIELIPQFLAYWNQGYDMVYGVRQNRENESRVKRLCANLFYRGMNYLTEIPIPPNAGDFRLLDRRVVNAIRSCQERNRFMKGLYNFVGFKSIGIPYQVQERQEGTSRWGFGRLTELALTGITSFSSVPLRVWGLIGCFVSLWSLLYAAFIVYDTLRYGAVVPGFATIVVAVMFLGGIQLLSIGILGEYLGRVFNEVKGRPTYIIAEKIGLDDG